MDVVDVVLLVLAAVCFALAAAGVESRVPLVPVGLLLWVIVPLIDAIELL